MTAGAEICAFGWPAPDFALEGTNGRHYGLADLRGPKGLLVMFICNHCPYVKAAIDRIVADVAALQKAGIGAAAIMPNDTEAYPADSFENMKRFASQHRFTFPYLVDRTQETARAYNAICTPDFFGFNASLELQYRGRLDDGRMGPPSIDAKRELLEAMREIARSGAGPKVQIASMGCSIKWHGA